MAAYSSDGPKPLDRSDLDYIRGALSSEAVDPASVFQHTSPSDYNTVWEQLRSLVGSPIPYKYLRLNAGSGKHTAAALWNISQNQDLMINGLSPVFIFLAVPDFVTNTRAARRSLLCTIISEVSDHITFVPSDIMCQHGVYGGQFASRLTEHENGLIDLLSVLRHCDFETGYEAMTDSGAIANVNYVYIVVMDRIKRFSDRSSYYALKFDQALQETVVNKMGAKILYIEEAGNQPTRAFDNMETWYDVMGTRNGYE